MKFSEAWLRDWVDPPIDTATLAAQLTMAGLEVDGIEPAAPEFSGVVLGRVLETARHPDADKLTVCTVDAGQDGPLNIVCGAPNVRAGITVPVALVGARLPGGMKIRKTRLRGVVSMGMICSVRELGLGEEHDGIMILSGEGEPGQCFRDYLELDDTVIEIDLTPNRGDCLGLLGVAREVAALNSLPLAEPEVSAVPAQVEDTFPVDLQAPDGCPVYAGRVVRNIRQGAQTPLWMAERLRRAGVRPIHAVVDVTNYVMLELGQPMHGFDLRRLHGGIVVRMAQPSETLTLLDGRSVTLSDDVLVIADHAGVKALAGIMGGEDTGVDDDTCDVFFESAWFNPLTVAGRARRYGMHTDASQRFERGVDPTGQARAVERATELLLAIAGGEPGPLTVARSNAHVPGRPSVTLRRPRLDRLLGVSVPDATVKDIFSRLGVRCEVIAEGWRLTPPGARFDLEIEADFIEEVARIHGYDRIPETPCEAAMTPPGCTETRVPLQRAREVLSARGYQEAITYSFVDPALLAAIDPEGVPVALANPISSEMSVMRTTLWAGLLEAARQNASRQQARVRLHEYGLRFIQQGNELIQENALSALAMGPRDPEQWSAGPTPVDWFDMKADLVAVLALTGRDGDFLFSAASHPALHPGQSAQIELEGKSAGWCGALHPRLQRELGFDRPVMLFEVATDLAFAARIPHFETLSKFPAVRRDLAVIVDETVSARALTDVVRDAAPKILRNVRIFDVYRGQGIDSGRKSVALGLILQDSSRTLTDQDADAAVRAVVAGLASNLNAKIRD